MRYYITFILIALIAVQISCRSDSKTDQRKRVESEHVIQSNSIEINEPWVRPGAKGANSAAYLFVFNGTNTADTLIAVYTAVADNAELHQSYEENDMTGMRPAGPLTIEPDSMLHLQPGGYHIMFMQLTQSLSAGDSIRITLEFSNAGKNNVNVPVKASN